MVQTVTKHRASDGTEFDNDFDAWKHELFLWLKPKADNDAIAHKIVAALVDGRPETVDTLMNIVAGLTRTAPERVGDGFPTGREIYERSMAK